MASKTLKPGTERKKILPMYIETEFLNTARLNSEIAKKGFFIKKKMILFN